MKTELSSLDDRQSVLIKAMRFPLIVLVVFAHSVGTFPTSTVEWSLDGWNVYHFVSEMFSRHLFSIGTCWFFVFSGYLFLRYLNEGDFGFQWVKAKWKKRIWSLLIPYLFWNLFSVLVTVVKNTVFRAVSLETEPLSGTPLYWFFTGPADYPLWFLRDLMLITLFLPLFYLLFKKFKWASLVFLVLVYLSPWNPTIPTMRSIFFVLAGAWLGTFKIKLLSLCRRIKVPAVILAISLLFLATSQIGRPLHTLLLRLFYPFGMIVFMNFCDSLINNERRRENLCNLSASVFFIYAAHEIYILGWTKGLCLRLFGDSLAGTWISYWLVPIIVLGVCLGLYYLLNHIMPHTLSFVCGGRSKK